MANPLPKSNPVAQFLRTRLRELRSDNSGAAAVIGAALFPVVIGGMALGAETGYWYFTQRKLQHAADISAHAAGVRKRAGEPKSQIDAAALHIATEAGFSASIGAFAVNTPPLIGPNTGAANTIEVIIREKHRRLFSSIFSDATLILAARTVVRITEGSQACVLALSPTAPGAVTVSGSTTVTLNGCDVASNSNALDALKMQGDGRLATECVHTVGEAIVTANFVSNTCASVREYAPVTRDPYADLEEPVVSGSCRSKTVTDTNLVPTEPHPSGLKVMRFCSGLNVKGSVTFSPGLYIIESADFTVNAGANLAGSGVTFYFTNGAGLKLNGAATVNFAGPTDGPYSGILFFGERDSTVAANQVNGASGSTFNGAVYFPASAVEYSGRAGSTAGCTQIIGKTVTFTGNSEVKSDCHAAGAREISTNQAVKIVE